MILGKIRRPNKWQGPHIVVHWICMKVRIVIYYLDSGTLVHHTNPKRKQENNLGRFSRLRFGLVLCDPSAKVALSNYLPRGNL